MSTTSDEPGPSRYQEHMNGHKDTNENGEQTFECNICLETAKDAVISVCGHLFCWPCLHQWLETRPGKQLCPVCKAGISRDKVIPLYGRGGTTQDPRSKVPPRPNGQRPEPQTSWGGFTGFGDGFHVSFGIGAFPFTLFSQSFSFGNFTDPHRPQPIDNGLVSIIIMLLTIMGSIGFLIVPLLSAVLFFAVGLIGITEEVGSKFFIWIAALFILWLIMT